MQIAKELDHNGRNASDNQTDAVAKNRVPKTVGEISGCLLVSAIHQNVLAEGFGEWVEAR